MLKRIDAHPWYRAYVGTDTATGELDAVLDPFDALLHVRRHRP